MIQLVLHILRSKGQPTIEFHPSHYSGDPYLWEGDRALFVKMSNRMINIKFRVEINGEAHASNNAEVIILFKCR